MQISYNRSDMLHQLFSVIIICSAIRRIVTLTAPGSAAASGICSGYVDSRGVCYEVFAKDAQNQDAAESNCASAGGHLASVQSAEEQKTLEKYLTMVANTTPLWIGGKLDQPPEKPFLWRWTSDGQVIEAQGCYIDREWYRDLPAQISDIKGGMTPGKCIDACAKDNYTFAGLQSGDSCFCGESYGSYGPIDTSKDQENCVRSCSGDSSLRCGGYERNYIYCIPCNGSFSLWGYGRPNNYEGYQTCALLTSELTYKFDDDSCGQTVANYICNIPLSSCTSGESDSYFRFGDTCYVISGDQCTWFVARMRCRAKGGDLVRIRSRDEFDLLVSQLIALKYWIGLRALPWIWSDGSNLTFANWYNGSSTPQRADWQPMNISNRCMLLDPSLNYQWTDAYCLSAYPYICQRNATQNHTSVPHETTSAQVLSTLVKTTSATTTSVTTSVTTAMVTTTFVTPSSTASTSAVQTTTSTTTTMPTTTTAQARTSTTTPSFMAPTTTTTWLDLFATTTYPGWRSIAIPFQEVDRSTSPENTTDDLFGGGGNNLSEPDQSNSMDSQLAAERMSPAAIAIVVLVCILAVVTTMAVLMVPVWRKICPKLSNKVSPLDSEETLYTTVEPEQSNSDVQPLVTESQTKAIKEDQNEAMKENKENNNKETEPDAKQEQKQLEDKDDFDGFNMKPFEKTDTEIV